MAVDPIVVVCNIVVSLQTVVSRSIDPRRAAVVTVGTITAGKAVNVIPESARFEISIRSFEPDVRQVLEDRITALTTSIAEGYGATAKIDYDRGHPVVCIRFLKTNSPPKSRGS